MRPNLVSNRVDPQQRVQSAALRVPSWVKDFLLIFSLLHLSIDRGEGAIVYYPGFPTRPSCPAPLAMSALHLPRSFHIEPGFDCLDVFSILTFLLDS